MVKLGEFLFGKKQKIKPVSTLTPLQQQLMELINQGITSGEGPFKDIFGGFDKGAFEEGVSKPALKMFQEQILPQIQEKFIAGNQVAGSGMQRAQLKAGTDLQSQLAQLMYQAQQDAVKNKIGGVNSLLGVRAVENLVKGGTTGAIPSFIQGASSGFGQGVGQGIAQGYPLFGKGGPGVQATPIQTAVG